MTEPLSMTVRRIVASDQAQWQSLWRAYLTHADFWKLTPICYLQDLFTVAEARGKGAARSLMQAVFDDATEMGIPDVYWQTADTNYTGRMLYDRIGVKTPYIVYQRSA